MEHRPLYKTVAAFVAYGLLLGEFFKYLYQSFLQKRLPPDKAAQVITDAIDAVPQFLMLGIAVGVGSALIWQWWQGHRKDTSAAPQGASTLRPVTNEKLESVIGRTFRNERVVLDGKALVGCEFHNVTLVYNGGPLSLVDGKFHGAMSASDVPEINAYVQFLHSLGLLPLPNLAEKDPAAQRPGRGLATREGGS